MLIELKGSGNLNLTTNSNVDLLNWEIFVTLEEARILIEQWRREYNQVRPHSSLGYRPPAPEARLPVTLT